MTKSYILAIAISFVIGFVAGNPFWFSQARSGSTELCRKS